MSSANLKTVLESIFCKVVLLHLIHPLRVATFEIGKNGDHCDLLLLTEMKEEKLQTSVLGHCYCFLVEYLAVAGLMNFLTQLSDRIHHFTVSNLMPLAFLTKLSNMH